MEAAKNPANKLLLEIQALRNQLREFEQQKQDLEITLEVTTAHGDLIENDLFLKVRAFREKLDVLEAQIKQLYQEKSDLQISLEAITDHADEFENELRGTQQQLANEIIQRNQELADKNIRLQAEIKIREQIQADLTVAASVFQAGNEGIIITDADVNVLKINQAFINLTGYNESEIVGKNPSILKSGRHDQAFFQNMWESILTVGYWNGEVWNRRKNAELFPCWLNISTIKDEQGYISHYIGIFSDNSNQKRTQEQIYQLSHYDALTKLPNRVLLRDRLEQTLKRANREQRWVGLFFIDLDRFKAINDAFGHPAGDELLYTVASRLTALLPDNQDNLARLGGDEFIMMLPSLAEVNAVSQCAESADMILDSLRKPLQLVGHEIFITTSVGVALYPQDGETFEELLKNADTAMYNAKERGRDNYQFFAKAMNNSVHKRLTLQNGLRRAIERDELVIHYQPQIDIRNQRIVGVEALLRWKHPEHGVVSPTEFIPIAEESGMIIHIGEWVLRTACLQQQQWLKKGLPSIRVAVNLSVRQFYDEKLVDEVNRVLQDTGFPAANLELEITESIAMSDTPKALETLNALKLLGIQLAIDDFGTGYSSLSYLKKFNADVLKIDGSFTADIASPKGAALVAAIINMAHSLKMKVIVEGVETQQQYAFLQNHACNYLQGYLFYPPLPAAELEALLALEKNGKKKP